MEAGLNHATHVPTRPFSHAVSLSAVLSMRAVTNGAFCIWLLTQRPRWVEVFQAGAIYGIIDGLLGLLTVALLARGAPNGAPPLLRVTTVFDALVRLAVSVTLRLVPAIPEMPLTYVLFFGILGSYAATLGILAVVVWLVAHHRWRTGTSAWRPGTGELFDPLAIAGLLTIGVVGYAVIVGPPATDPGLRAIAATISAGFAGAYLVSGAGALRQNRNGRAAV